MAEESKLREARNLNRPSKGASGEELRLLSIPRADDFWSKVDKNGPGGCWLWQGYKSGRPRFEYGSFSLPEYGTARAHRVAYALAGGDFSADQQLDHLCRTTLCVNPAHLEPVSSKENTLRGVGPTAVNARKNRCTRGHPLSGDNLFYNRGWRICKTCHYAYARETKRRRRERKRLAKASEVAAVQQTGEA